MLVIFAAGGTGGHIYPAIAVAKELEKNSQRKVKVLFIGTGAAIESRLISAAGFEYLPVSAKPVVGKGLLGLLEFFVTLPTSLSKMLALFRERQPIGVVGFGGYPSFLPILAAWAKGIPTAIQEQNIRSGIANRVLNLLARKAFAPARSGPWYFKSRVIEVANPVRSEFYDIPSVDIPSVQLSEPGAKVNVLVVGGSQGAIGLNTAVIAQIELFKELGFEVTHQSGEKDFERIRAAYESKGFIQARIVPFIDDMAAAYAKSHLVICRAGATTVAELSAAGRAAIFVPLPIAKGHQAENVTAAVKAGAALCLKQDEQLNQKLANAIRQLGQNRGQLLEMGANFRKLSQVDGVLKERAAGASLSSTGVTPAKFIANAIAEQIFAK